MINSLVKTLEQLPWDDIQIILWIVFFIVSIIGIDTRIQKKLGIKVHLEEY